MRIRWVVALLPALCCLSATAWGQRKFEPTIESLQQHRLPSWFDGAKLGVLVTYGLFSVPAFAPPSGELGKVDFKVWFLQNPYAEWYENSMKIKESPTWTYHVEHYGEGFAYADFIPLFQRESRRWKPEEWARLFADAGIRYAVLTSKFADGYPMWPTAVKHPKLKVDHLAAERDYVGEFTQAIRAGGLKVGLYYSGGMDWAFVPEPVRTFPDVFKTIPQSAEYVKVADAHWRELLARYDPDILWNDISYPKAGDARGIIADFYNRKSDGVVNNRFGLAWADYTTPEYARMSRITMKKWETCRGLGYSFGYNQAEGPEHLLSGDQLVDLVADIVSKNGNLMIGIGPAADGSISELQRQRLRALGAWLRINGEAIYGTRPWVGAEGRTSDGGRVRFTRKGDAVYALVLDPPKSAAITIEALVAGEGSTVTLLGAKGNLTWAQRGTSLEIRLPEDVAPSEAYAIRISPLPYKLVRDSEVDYQPPQGLSPF